MSDIIAPIVVDTDGPLQLQDSDPLQLQQQGSLQLQGPPNDPLRLKSSHSLLQSQAGNGAERKKQQAARGSSKPSLSSSRLEHLKISTIRQHYYPEGGWGWVVCGCAFVINVLTMGLLLAYGVLYREVVAEFGEEYADQASK